MPKRSNIEQLIHDMCPSGIEYKMLGEIATRNKGANITAGKMKAIADPNGDVRIFAAGNTVVDVCGKDIPQANIIRKPSIIVKSRGYVSFEYYDAPFTHKNEMWSYSNFVNANIKYVFYYLEQHAAYFQAIAKANSVKLPQLCVGDTDNYRIPLPPIEIQDEIVRMLDTFAKLIDNIETEIDARQKQLVEAREKLFADVKDNWEEKALEDIGDVIKGSGILKSDFVAVGCPCIHYGQVHTLYGTSAKEVIAYISEKLYAKCKKAQTGDLVIATTSEDVPACCKATAWLGKDDVAVSGDAHILHHNQDPLFMSYLFQTDLFSQQRALAAVGAKVTRVSGDKLKKFRFFFPPIKEQQAIAAKLDTIEAFIANLNEERTLRQQQYEYYRAKLISLLK